jgi:hypothetical protein
MWKRFMGLVVCGHALLGCSGPPVTSDGVVRSDGAVTDASLSPADVGAEALDCRNFNSYMASLGTLTANCLGTVDPRSYELDTDGFLVPTFNACVDGDQVKLSSIRQLLSLQYRPARLPAGKACMAGRYAMARAEFEAAGAPVCPAWEFVRTENPITEQVVTRVTGQLPKLPSTEPLPAGILDGDFPALETINLYAVRFSDSPEAESSRGSIAASELNGENGRSVHSDGKDATSTAALCASPFPGFVVRPSKTPDGREGLLTDPDAWLESTAYLNAAADPYLRPIYYHPMSYYGGAPGVQFGNPVRAMPCGLNPDGTPICIAEACSYWTGSSHKKVRLQLDCNDYSNIATCVSYCGPPLPPPPQLPQLP